MKKLFIIALLALAGCTAQSPKQVFVLPEDESFNFIMLNDAGRNGYYDQKTVAATMGRIAETTDFEFVAAAGDIFHYLGIQSTADPLLMTNYESIYSHPELQVEWYPILGNHEYSGNSQAVIDYSAVSRRWSMPDRYYTKSFDIPGDGTLRVVWVDTAPLIDKYRKKSGEYPDAGQQDMDAQLAWVDSVLTASSDTWKIVIGHHPIWAGTDKNDSERGDLQARLEPILVRHGVDMYLCGHIHNFQHIRRPNSDIDYVVNGSGSLGREVVAQEGQIFTSSSTGFSVVAASADSLRLFMLDRDARVLYAVNRGK